MNTPTEDRDDCELFELAKMVFIEGREVSVSLMQRRLILGYSRALKIMDQLEQAGVVTPLSAENVRALTPQYMTLEKD